MRLLGLILATGLCATTAITAVAAGPRRDNALVKELQAFADASKIVAAPTGDRTDSLKQVRHSEWANDLVERAKVFIGDGADLERASSPYMPCYQAAWDARELWRKRMEYGMQPTQDRYRSVVEWDARFSKAMAACNAAQSRK